MGQNGGILGGEALMADAYTVFWTMDRWLGAVAVGNKPLPVLFGGSHLSDTSFRRAGVRVGDTIYPIAVSNRKVYVVASMRVREMLLIGQEDGPALIDQRFPQYRAWKFLAPAGIEEVIIGIEGTTPRADLELPGEMLDRLTFRSQRGERPFKQVKDGELTNTLALQRIYRLAASSAADLAELVESPRGTSRSDRRPVATPDEALF
jgi:hypothetical protein